MMMSIRVAVVLMLAVDALGALSSYGSNDLALWRAGDVPVNTVVNAGLSPNEIARSRRRGGSPNLPILAQTGTLQNDQHKQDPTILVSLMAHEKSLNTKENALLGVADAPAAHKMAVDLPQIFEFVVIIYGSIGALWIAHWRATKNAQESGAFLEQMRVGLLCMTWASMSIGMHVLNKSLATTLKAPSLITIAQMTVAVVIIGCTSGREVLKANGKQLFTWMIVPIFFAAMLITSFYTYEIISLSLLTVLRNLTPLIVLPIESFVMPPERRPLVNSWVVGPILVMLAGAVVYSGSIEDLSVLGITFAVINMIIAIGDRLIQRRLLTTECQELPSSVCAFVNNLFGMIPTLILAWSTGEIQGMDVETQVAWTDPKVLTIVLLSGLVGLGICYFGVECQRAISATSFFVLQNVSKLAVVSMGVLIFHDPIKSPVILLGLLLSLGGSFLYGHGQLLAQVTAKQDQGGAEQTAVCETQKEDMTQSNLREGKADV